MPIIDPKTLARSAAQRLARLGRHQSAPEVPAQGGVQDAHEHEQAGEYEAARAELVPLGDCKLAPLAETNPDPGPQEGAPDTSSAQVMTNSTIQPRWRPAPPAAPSEGVDARFEGDAGFARALREIGARAIPDPALTVTRKL